MAAYLGTEPNQIPMTEATTTGAPKRPTFLTVLCILSFIAGGWGVIGGIINLMSAPSADEVRAQLEGSMSGMGDMEGAEALGGLMNSMADTAVKAAEAAKPMAIGGIVIALISLFGVWKMWNLQKQGFWIYVAACIASFILPMIFLGGGLLAAMSAGVGGLISIVFIILYGLNLKHMH